VSGAQEQGFSPEEFGRAFQRFLEWMTPFDRSDNPPFKTMLTEHFGEDPALFPVIGQDVSPHDLPNLQLALDVWRTSTSARRWRCSSAGGR
jgi:hypothetical protein